MREHEKLRIISDIVDDVFRLRFSGSMRMDGHVHPLMNCYSSISAGDLRIR